MSECVVRMEMPKSCDACPCLDDYGDYPRCRISGEQRGYNFPILEKRMPNCPIGCALPKGHGRLVDAKRLEYELCEGTLPKKYCDFVRRVLNSENLTPTIVPAEPPKEDADADK